MKPEGIVILAIAGFTFLIGYVVGDGKYEAKIDRCHQYAEQTTEFGQYGARAFAFAVCVNPERYDPQYEYKRFKAK